MFFNNFKSIKLKLVFLFSLSAIIAILLTSITMFTYTYYELQNDSKKSLANIADIMSQNLSAPIEFDDIESTNTLLYTLNVDPDIVGAFIFKNEDEEFTSFLKTKDEKQKIDTLVATTLKSSNIKEHVSTMLKGYIIVNSPIKMEDEYIASLVIVASTESLNLTVFKQFIVASIASLISLLIVIFLARKLQSTFTKPIFSLKNTMENVSIGNDYSVVIENNNNDEFYALFDGFNQMIRKINTQDIEVKNAKIEIEEIHKHTRESIEYASLIQAALVPDNQVFKKYFKDYFAVWHPKDLVGGDIYLFEELRHDDECLIMFIDCTGHGVPGAFVTMLVKAIERQITSKIKHSDEIVSPAKILGIFNKNMKQLLKQESIESISNAGFDGGVVYYNKIDKQIKFAGAETPLFYIEDDELKTIKGNRYSVGYKKCAMDYEYKEHIIDVKEGMKFYLTTDGYIDQNGGEKGFPFGKKRFTNIIKENYNESFLNQEETFIDTLTKYQGNEERNDDVTLIAFET